MAEDVASSSGDLPATSTAEGSAAAASKAAAAAVQLARTAQCSGVPPTASRAFGAAPASSSASTACIHPHTRRVCRRPSWTSTGGAATALRMEQSSEPQREMH